MCGLTGSCDLNTEASGLIKGWKVLPEGLSVQKNRDPCSWCCICNRGTEFIFPALPIDNGNWNRRQGHCSILVYGSVMTVYLSIRNIM